MNQAYIKTEYVKSLTPQAFAALVGVLLNSHKIPMGNECCYSTPFIIANILTGKEPTESDVRNINKGFSDLASNGFVEKSHNNSYYFLINYSKFERSNEPYICIEENEVRAIMNNNGDVNNYNLLQYFAYLKTTFDFETNIGTRPILYLSEKTGKSVITVNKYHKSLEKVGVLRVFRFRTSRMPDGTLKKLVNVYYLPGNEKAALHFLQESGKLSKLKDETFSDQPGV